MERSIQMTPAVVSTDRAPRSLSPLSQAVRFGQLLFVSGQVPVNPETGAAVDDGIRDQTRQTMDNLRAILEEAGSSLDEILKTSCFLTNMDDFAAFNEVYAEYFPNRVPARSTFEVSRLAGAFRVEIEAIACIPGER